MDFFVFIIWLVLAILVGVFATNRGHSGIVFFLIAAVLSPLIGFIIVLVMKPNTQEIESWSIESGELKKCPDCAELVKSEAKICKHCGNELPSSKQIFKIKTIHTPELTKELVNAYTKVRDKDYESRQEVVEKIAKKFDVEPVSIIVKLSALGIYVPKVYTPRNYGPRKGALVDKIAVR